ncbi:hypothetical protein BH23VER1_BH23VER1_15880 [soil metagenome]
MGASEPVAPPESAIDWWTGEGVSIGGILFPHFHAAGAFGGSTAGEIDGLAVGHHDPQAAATLQSLEPGMSLRAGDYVEGFVTYTTFTDADGNLEDGEWEEAFLKLKGLPGGFELRGGRFLNRFGFQNATHSHGWHFVNQNLFNGRLLQEGEVITDGGEITWNLPTPFRSALSFSYGVAPEHSEDEHGHGDEEPLFEGEGARFIDDFFGGHFIAAYNYNDFHQHRFTLSGAWGENEFGRTSQLYGIGYEYQWRENGLAPGGRYFRWRNELGYRTFGAVGEEEEEDDDHGHDEEEEEDEEHGHGGDGRRADLDEIGLYTMLAYGFNDRVETGVRVGYVSGIADAGLDERWRVSPNVTISLNAQRTLYLRLQYDYDHSSDLGDEHSAWAQIGFNWGGAEVR